MTDQTLTSLLQKPTTKRRLGGPPYSPLRMWITDNHQDFSHVESRQGWAYIARELNNAGHTLNNGKPITAHTLRNIWLRIQRDMAAGSDR